MKDLKLELLFDTPCNLKENGGFIWCLRHHPAKITSAEEALSIRLVEHFCRGRWVVEITGHDDISANGHLGID